MSLPKKPAENPKGNRDRAKILRDLEKAKGSEERVRLFAEIMDKKGFEAIVGLFPEVGDASMSAIAGLYLILEANRAGLEKSDYLKIIGLQATDLFVGSVPIVGDIADFLFKSNLRSADLFAKRTAALVREAQAAGVPEEEIAKITAEPDTLPQLVRRMIRWTTGAKLGELKNSIAR